MNTAEQRGSIAPASFPRFAAFYGQVYDAQNARILSVLPEGAVLDLGCGIGAWLMDLRKRGVHAFGVDLDFASLAHLRRTFDTPAVLAAAETWPLRNHTIDVLLFREAAHHFDMPRVLAEARRAGVKEIRAFEPNAGIYLHLLHLLVRHRDASYPARQCRADLEAAGYEVITYTCSDLLLLPLSGGLIAPWTVPALGTLGRILLRLEERFLSLLPLGLQKSLCLRYQIRARVRGESARNGSSEYPT